MSVEQVFFNKMQERPSAVTIFLLNGVKLQGQIEQSDERTLILRRERMTQLVYKHAISTIMPIDPVDGL